MATYRRHLKHWCEVKRVIGGKVETTTCCCADPGGTRNTCRLWSGNKTPCRCHCHTLQIQEEKETAKRIKDKP
jgi:hypothetical protein